MENCSLSLLVLGVVRAIYRICKMHELIMEPLEVVACMYRNLFMSTFLRLIIARPGGRGMFVHRVLLMFVSSPMRNGKVENSNKSTICTVALRLLSFLSSCFYCSTRQSCLCLYVQPEL
jgi:hypothetical protein